MLYCFYEYTKGVSGMPKIIIADEQRNAEIISAILKSRFETVMVANGRGVQEKLYVEKPDILLISADSQMINYKAVITNMVRRNRDFAAMPVLIISSAPTPADETSAKVLNAEIIQRPFDPLELVKKAEELAIQLIPLKDRLDPVTKLHKREYTEERIQEIFPKKSGTLFLVEVGKYKFASQPASEELAAKAAEVVAEEVKAFKAILGVEKDRKFIGYIPDISERAICMSWGKKLIQKIQEIFGEEKVYVSVGFACNDEKSPTYKDLFQTCDRAISLCREKGKNIASYY